MRFPINLASEPFRRDRPVFVASVVLSAILGAILAGLVWMAYVQRHQSSDTRTEIASVDKQLATIAQEQSKISQALQRPDNAEVLNRTLFLNSLLQRKGISWTRIFADLETVVPHNVRVISVRPQINGQNQVQLDLFVGSQTTDPVIQMLMKMEGSTLFGRTAIASWLPPSQTDPLYRYRLTVNYAQKL